MDFNHKDLLDLTEFSAVEIEHILDTAEGFKEISEREIKKVPTLRGKTVVHFFYEASTRTRTSFEIAAKRLSADTVNLSASTSSLVKGETLADTVMNLEAMKPDAIVIRHPSSGVPHMIAGLVDSAVINAGDGTHAHPTQALLDMLTIREALGRLEGIKVTIIGDISHSRVARSNIVGLIKMGAEVRVCGPPTMMPPAIEDYGVKVFDRPEAALHQADVIMMLRIQMERADRHLFPGTREYARVYGLTPARVAMAGDNPIIMHPGPMNRGVEISPEVADGPHSVILDQVTNGIAVRMALLYLLIGGEKSA